jgi:hypothetical protein
MKIDLKEIFSLILSIFVVCLLGSAGDALASDPLATVSVGAKKITWEPEQKDVAWRLRVVGPGDAVFEKTFGAGSIPSFQLRDNNGNPFGDGPCIYELTAIPSLSSEILEVVAAARRSGDTAVLDALKKAGCYPKAGSVGRFSHRRGNDRHGECRHRRHHGRPGSFR